MTTETISIITQEEADTAAAAAKAQRAAAAATARAEAARSQADAQRTQRMAELADTLGKEWPAKRDAALTALADAREALESAVAAGGDVLLSYRALIRTSIHVYEVDSELAQIRELCGRPTREPAAPVFDFSRDIGSIFNQLGMELTDDALGRITRRRADFINGGKS
jgi:hypothetical protein